MTCQVAVPQDCVQRAQQHLDVVLLRRQDGPSHLRLVADPVVNSCLQPGLRVLPFIPLLGLLLEEGLHVLCSCHFGSELLACICVSEVGCWLLVSEVDPIEVIQEGAVYWVSWLRVAL